MKPPMRNNTKTMEINATLRLDIPDRLILQLLQPLLSILAPNSNIKQKQRNRNKRNTNNQKQQNQPPQPTLTSSTLKRKMKLEEKVLEALFFYKCIFYFLLLYMFGLVWFGFSTTSSLFYQPSWRLQP